MVFFASFIADTFTLYLSIEFVVRRDDFFILDVFLCIAMFVFDKLGKRNFIFSVTKESF